MRGTGCSGGVFDVFNPAQKADGYDVVEIVARQPWVLNGKVGMVGLSYSGITQLYTAATRPAAPGRDHRPVGDRRPVARSSGRAASTTAASPSSGWRSATASRRRAAPSWVTRRIEGGDTACADHQPLRNQNPDFDDVRPGARRCYRPIADARDLRRLVHDIERPGVHHRGLPGRADRPAVRARCSTTSTTPPALRVSLWNGRHPDGYAPANMTRCTSSSSCYVAERVPRHATRCCGPRCRRRWPSSSGSPGRRPRARPVRPTSATTTRRRPGRVRGRGPGAGGVRERQRRRRGRASPAARSRDFPTVAAARRPEPTDLVPGRRRRAAARRARPADAGGRRRVPLRPRRPAQTSLFAAPATTRCSTRSRPAPTGAGSPPGERAVVPDRPVREDPVVAGPGYADLAWRRRRGRRRAGGGVGGAARRRRVPGAERLAAARAPGRRRRALDRPRDRRTPSPSTSTCRCTPGRVRGGQDRHPRRSPTSSAAGSRLRLTIARPRDATTPPGRSRTPTDGVARPTYQVGPHGGPAVGAGAAGARPRRRARRRHRRRAPASAAWPAAPTSPGANTGAYR